MAPSLGKLSKGGVCAWLGVSAMRARVWAAGGVKVNMQQISSNFQDSDNV